MSETFTQVVLPLLIAVIAATGGWSTAWWQARKASRETTQQLIDQLQEERNHADDQLQREREASAAKVDKLSAQIDRFFTDKAASRKHVAALNDHIWQRRDPPPPDPPAGYIA